MYGQMRISLLDRVLSATERLARVGRLALGLAAGTRWTPTDLFAALATARFMAAHQLIDQTSDAVEAADDDEFDVIQIRQPLWFGGQSIHEEQS